MPLDAIIKDGRGTGNKAKVTSQGQLVVAPLDFSSAYAVTASVINTAYNFVGPIAAKQFVITDLLLYADKNVGAGDASIQVYEASSSTSTTEDKTIINIEMLKQTSRDINGMNLIVSKGKWVNIKTNDNNVYATLMGYYIDAL